MPIPSKSVGDNDSVRHYRWRDFLAEVRWPNEETMAGGEVVLTYHGIRLIEQLDKLADWSIHFSIEEPDASVTRHAREISRHQSGLRILGHEGLVYLWNGRSLGTIDAAERRVVGHLHPSRTSLSTGLDVDLFLITTFGLLALMQQERVFALHAASLVSPSDVCMLLVAESDSGKSTITSTLARQGWNYLSDDSVVLEAMDDAIEAMPFRRDFGLDPEAENHFPEIVAAAVPQLTDAAKWCIDPTKVFPGRRVERARPSVIVFPSIRDIPTSRLEPVSQADALVELLKQSSFLTFDRDATSDYMQVLRRLVSQSVCMRLIAGHDLRDDPAQVNLLLAKAIPDLAEPVRP